MTFTHSPGPWSLSPGENSNFVELNSPYHSAFAQIVVGMGDRTPPDTSLKLRGNAQLLRYALEMYNMLQSVEHYLNYAANASTKTTYMRVGVKKLIEAIETLPTTRDLMLQAVVDGMVDSLGDRKERVQFAQRHFEQMDDAQLAKAYNDMQVPK